MSLARLDLRAATVEALLGGEGAYPTMAGPLVFDSKMDELQSDTGEQSFPAIIVYTDADQHERPNAGAGGYVFHERRIDLVITMAIATNAGNVLRYVTTDAALEAFLDLIEWQVWRTLTNAFAPASHRFQRLVKRIEKWSSVPGRAADQAQRVAMRQMTAEVIVNNDCRVGASVGEPEPAEVATSLLPPGPHLVDLEARLTADPSMALLVAQLTEARTGVPSIVLPRLLRLAGGYFTSQPNAAGDELVVSPDTRVPVNWRTKT